MTKIFILEWLFTNGEKINVPVYTYETQDGSISSVGLISEEDWLKIKEKYHSPLIWKHVGSFRANDVVYRAVKDVIFI